ncbi:MAG: hypothetical protein RIR94_225 [Bacteroidota bacterium]|jgi:hypothetical protein
MKKTILLSLLTVLLFSCGKINTPNAESEKIFGTWRFVSSSGGFSGAGNSSYDATDTYEYKENGAFSHRKDGQLIDQMSFSLQLGPSITSQTDQLLIHYGVVGYKQSFQINNDTLFLSDEVYDGFQYVFVKQ